MGPSPTSPTNTSTPVTTRSHEPFAGQFRLNFLNGDRWKWIVQGLGRTLLITLFAVIVGVLIGIIIAAIRSSL